MLYLADEWSGHQTRRNPYQNQCDIGYMKEYVEGQEKDDAFFRRKKMDNQRYIMKRTRRLNKTDVEDKIGICFNGKEINGETGVKNKSNEFIFTRLPGVEPD